MKAPGHYLNIIRWKVYRYWRDLEVPFTWDEYRIRRLRNGHKGRRAFIIGNGPSMRPEYFHLLKGELSFGFNGVYRVFSSTSWRPDYLLVHDPVLAARLKEDFRIDPGTRVLAGQSVRHILGDDRGITYYEIPFRTDTGAMPTFRTRMITGVQTGSTIVFAGLQFAWYMGVREFYVLGVDLNYSMKEHGTVDVHDGHDVIRADFTGSYFHPGLDPGSDLTMRPDLDGMTLAMLATKEFVEANGGRIYNAAPDSPMEIFPRRSIQELLSGK